MGIVAKKGQRITAWQSRTFNRTWTIYRNKEKTLLRDLTGWHGWFLFWGTDVTTPIKTLDSATGVAPTLTVEGTTGVILGGPLGTFQAYMTDEHAAILAADKFTLRRKSYFGGYELILQDLASQQYTYLYGELQVIPDTYHGS